MRSGRCRRTPCAMDRFRPSSAWRRRRWRRSRRPTWHPRRCGASTIRCARRAAGSGFIMRRAARQPFRVYRVGGSVRDELIGRAGGDRDWVVVGATPELMTASGYKPVGNDFPVFLHPETREEYALARTERKHGRDYRGFEFFASPEVTLEDDRARRDLTINAMAVDERGRL